MVLKGSS
jgi:hypothetical protein